jgi:DNA (cytosine-5)-methyltransferase 1
VRADLAREGYASRGVDIPACAVDAPHIRQRLYWVASDLGDPSDTGSQGRVSGRQDQGWEAEQRYVGCDGSAYSGGDMANASDNGPSFGPHPDAGRTEDERRRDADLRGEHLGSGSSVRDMADANHERCGEKGYSEKGRRIGGSSSHTSFWSDHIWLTGSDGKARRSKPGLPLLAHGVSNRVGRLRAYGNAIVPQVAAEVIRAFVEATEAA